jgi:hypothetical protein
MRRGRILAPRLGEAQMNMRHVCVQGYERCAARRDPTSTSASVPSSSAGTRRLNEVAASHDPRREAD